MRAEMFKVDSGLAVERRPRALKLDVLALIDQHVEQWWHRDPVAVRALQQLYWEVERLL